MKRLSIKTRVTLWYTGLVVLLLALGASYLGAASGELSLRQLRHTLADVVSEAVKAAQFPHGRLDPEEIDFYRDGVSIFLYDTSGHLLAPQVNRGIQVDAVLEDQVVKTVTAAGERWLVHDIYAVSGGTGFWVRGLLSLSGADATLQRMRLAALLAVPVGAAVSALGGWLITRRAFAAVGQMARTANAITSGSDLSLRVENDGSQDELSQLSSTLNSMLSRLQASFERERRFTSDVSHELRTPAAVIISQCEYGLSPTAAEAERQQALRACLRQGQRISSIVSQLLLLSRAENGKFTPAMEPVDLTALCEMVSLELEEEAARRQVTLQARLAPDICVQGDETLLIRMAINLLTNAIRYNRPGGRVTLSLAAEEGGCTLAVEDTGIGIAPGDLAHIWDRFFRAEASRSTEGVGLGLSMVQWIAQLHGGRVQAQSTPGQGSRFSVWLPGCGAKGAAENNPPF